MLHAFDLTFLLERGDSESMTFEWEASVQKHLFAFPFRPTKGPPGSCFVAGTTGYYNEMLGLFPSSHVCVNKSGYFKMKRDLFLTLTKWVLCLNLIPKPQWWTFEVEMNHLSCAAFCISPAWTSFACMNLKCKWNVVVESAPHLALREKPKQPCFLERLNCLLKLWATYSQSTSSIKLYGTCLLTLSKTV